jgi:hypothetical protein
VRLLKKSAVVALAFGISGARGGAMMVDTSTGPVAVCPANGHYLMYRSKPIILVTSDHHYGAVIDGEFDYGKFLDYLGENGMNLTRIYPGGMFEPDNKFVAGNPLGPRAGKQVLPWARTDVPGANPGLAEAGKPSMKYDLDRWNPEYFSRLRSFVDHALNRGIVVEVAFFNGMYADCWPLMAMYHGNNIQGAGKYEAEECGLFTTADPRNWDVMKYQKAYVVKITAELNEYDNVIFDLCDEPSLVGKPDGNIAVMPDEAVRPWLAALKDAFLTAEAGLPKKHLLGQTVQNLSPDMSSEPWCQWLAAEYVKPALAALERNYAAGKPIVDVESDYYGHGLVKPYLLDHVRVEGWWFMVGGGAGFINLNGEYFRGNESGSADTRDVIVPQKKALKTFMESIAFVRMTRFTGYSGLPAGVVASAIAEEGRQYALYMFHGGWDDHWGAHFTVAPGEYRSDRVVMKGVPAGTYGVEWIDPASGADRGGATVAHPGGDLVLTAPLYSMDIAVRIRRREG